MKRALVLVAVAGCNQVFGLHRTHATDAAQAATPADGLLWPPDGGTACAPPPDFSTWTVRPYSIPGWSSSVIHPALLTHDRAIFMYQSHLYDTGAGAPRLISELEPFQGVGQAAPSASCDGKSFWFARLNCITCSGIYYAVEDASGWVARVDDPIEAYQIQPGSVGFYAGSARMVMSIQHDAEELLHLVEVFSPDGLAWTQLPAPIPLGTQLQAYDPALSADGCFLLFTSPSTIDGNTDLYLSARGADGTFGTPSLLPFSTPRADEMWATLDPTMTRLWFTQGGALMEAVPP